MWRNWSIGLPVNQVPSGSDEDEYESPVDEDPNNLVSPRRPHQSPSASPRALLRPDPPPVDEVLVGVEQRLRTLPNRSQRAENRNAHRQAQQEAEAAAEAAAATAAATANMPANPPIVNFEDEDGNDDVQALQNACRNLEIPQVLIEARLTWKHA